ncbi:carbohydrate kinase family protein [Caproiciproducens sp. MSJ-32]|uniref:carbohydrate kinase family protein n=1 Tax=Caproiciproducens sp. MSJ-32 TaxID=2841527 RepID=UPI001C0F4A18|nr:carbohydrate kinase [Caproiciproducens sp. MSJ-32]MBU5453847.1 carbohydrate kinase [Caproiciproducens sp. MSJ-32]
MSNKVFCIGELLIDFIGKDNIKDLSRTVNFEKKAGGAPANVAASVSKLGGEAYFLGQVGNDSFGKFLIESLKEVNINVEMAKMEGYTTLAFVSIDENGERDFEFHRGSDGDYAFSNIDLAKISNKDIIHFGSATGFLEGELKNTYYKLLEYAKEKNIFISFDPNYRDALISNDKLEAFIEDCKNFIKLSDFVKLSDEEIKLITEEENIESGVKKLHKMGAKIVAVTLGAEGTLISNGNMEIVPSIKIKQLDSTGAGDAFVGAILKQLADLEDNKNINFNKWKTIVSYANKVGAITCTNYGAIASMPTAEEVEAWE